MKTIADFKIEDYWKPDLRSEVIQICARQEGLQKAIKLLRFIKDKKIKKETNKLAIEIEATRSGVASVARLVNQSELPELLEFYHSHFALIEVEKENIEEAWKHFAHMHDLVDKFRICENIIERQIRKKDFASTKKSLEKAMAVIALAEASDRFYPGWFRTFEYIPHGGKNNIDRLMQMTRWYAAVSDEKHAEKALKFTLQSIKWRYTPKKDKKRDDWFFAQRIGQITNTETLTLGRIAALKHARQYKELMVRAYASSALPKE